MQVSGLSQKNDDGYGDKKVRGQVKVWTKFILCWCLICNNPSQTVREYLAGMKYFHIMYAGGKGVDGANGNSGLNPCVPKPSMWEILVNRQRMMAGAATMVGVVVAGLSLTYLLM